MTTQINPFPVHKGDIALCVEELLACNPRHCVLLHATTNKGEMKYCLLHLCRISSADMQGVRAYAQAPLLSEMQVSCINYAYNVTMLEECIKQLEASRYLCKCDLQTRVKELRESNHYMSIYANSLRLRDR